jgi:hypothetical protein
MAGPNGDVDTSTANERDKQRLLDAAREAEGGERQEREPEPDIEVEDDRPPAEEPDDDEPGGELPADEPRAPREERRTNRFTEAQREAEVWRARALALEAQAAAARAPATPQRSREELEEEAREHYRRDIGAIQQARMDLQQVSRANKDNWTPEVEARVMAEDANLRILEADAQERYLERRRQANRPPQAAPVNPAIAVVVGRYQDVTRDQLGLAHANTYYMEQKRKGTKLDEVELVEESMKYGRAKLRGEAFSPATRERPRPTKNQQAKYTGTGSNSSAGAPAPSERRTITTEEKRLADKLYSHIQDPEMRKQMFYKNVKMKRGA